MPLVTLDSAVIKHCLDLAEESQAIAKEAIEASQAPAPVILTKVASTELLKQRAETLDLLLELGLMKQADVNAARKALEDGGELAALILMEKLASVTLSPFVDPAGDDEGRFVRKQALQTSKVRGAKPEPSKMDQLWSSAWAKVRTARG